VKYLPIILPTKLAVSKPFIKVSSSSSNFFLADINAAGNIPEAPAVGAATILPIEALTSIVENAIAIAKVTSSPQKDLPFL